jgi:hypothetical protein
MNGQGRLSVSEQGSELRDRFRAGVMLISQHYVYVYVGLGLGYASTG